MALIDKETIRAEIERRLSWRITLEARAAYNNILRFLDSLPEQPEPKPKAIVIRPTVNLQKELMGVSAEVKDAVMLLLKDGWSLKAPDSEREFDQRAVCAGFSSIPPKFKLDVKPEQPVIKKSNALFEECLANVDPAIRKEVSDNIDKMLGRKSMEGLEEAAEEWCKANNKGIALSADKKSHYLAEGKDAFIAGAEWQRKQDQSLIELAEDHAMLAGMNKMKEQMIEKAVDGRYMKADGKVYVESWPLDIDPDSVKAGDEVRLIVIPEKSEKVK